MRIAIRHFGLFIAIVAFSLATGQSAEAKKRRSRSKREPISQEIKCKDHPTTGQLVLRHMPAVDFFCEQFAALERQEFQKLMRAAFASVEMRDPNDSKSWVSPKSVAVNAESGTAFECLQNQQSQWRQTCTASAKKCCQPLYKTASITAEWPAGADGQYFRLSYSSGISILEHVQNGKNVKSYFCPQPDRAHKCPKI